MSRASSTGAIRVGNVRALPVVLESLGLDPRARLQSVGLSPAVFEEPEALVPIAAIDELLHKTVRETGCDHIGLMVGMASPDVGLPGFLMLNAPTVRTGLNDFVTSLSWFDSSSAVAFSEGTDTAILAHSLLAHDMRSADQIADLSAAVGYGLLSKLIGPTFEPVEIRLPRRAPLDAAPYKAFFRRGRIKFDAHETAIEFPAACLDAPVTRADNALYRFLKGLERKTETASECTIAEQIRRVLPNLVRREHVNNKAVAKMFGLHPRTMARRLAEEGVTLHGLVEDARFEVAKQLLIDTDLGLTEIAADLFYSDASAFARAFRRKIGETPGSWRKSGRREREATFHVSD
ncbi:MAG: AraC family transcriptional regulator ligand-binding domain-containing protein [Beijerinckiaceae bacterium]